MNTRFFLLTLTALTGCQTMLAQRATTPLEYVSEYSMGTNKQTGAFATSHRNDSCGWYTPDEAKRLVPQGYHVPSEYEMYILVPQKIDNYKKGDVKNVSFSPVTLSNQTEEVEIAGVRGIYKAEYIGFKENNRVHYGIRFIGNGNRYRSAYRYERVGYLGANSVGGYGDRKSYLLIQSKYLGSDYSLEDVAKEEFWQSGNIVTRVIPANGKISMGWKDGSLGSNWFNAKIGSMISILALSGTPITCNLFEFYGGGLSFWRFQGSRNDNYVYGGTAVVRPFLNKLPSQPTYNSNREIFTTYTTVAENRPTLPIDFVADFNVGKPTNIINVTKEGADGSKYQPGEYKEKMPAGFHIPTLYEMNGIFPEQMYAQSDDLNWTPYEKITINGKTSTYRAHYLYFLKANNLFLGYALKFIDDTNEYLSAYKYEFDRLTYNLKVSCRYLGPNFKGEVHELMYPGFWETKDVTTIQFPMFNAYHHSIELGNIFGNYEINDDGQSKFVTLGSDRMGAPSLSGHYEGSVVLRPFKNKVAPKNASAAKPASPTKKAPVRRATTVRPAQKLKK